MFFKKKTHNCNKQSNSFTSPYYRSNAKLSFLKNYVLFFIHPLIFYYLLIKKISKVSKIVICYEIINKSVTILFIYDEKIHSECLNSISIEGTISYIMSSLKLYEILYRYPVYLSLDFKSFSRNAIF